MKVEPAALLRIGLQPAELLLRVLRIEAFPRIIDLALPHRLSQRLGVARARRLLAPRFAAPTLVEHRSALVLHDARGAVPEQREERPRLRLPHALPVGTNVFADTDVDLVLDLFICPHRAAPGPHALPHLAVRLWTAHLDPGELPLVAVLPEGGMNVARAVRSHPPAEQHHQIERLTEAAPLVELQELLVGQAHPLAGVRLGLGRQRNRPGHVGLHQRRALEGREDLAEIAPELQQIAGCLAGGGHGVERARHVVFAHALDVEVAEHGQGVRRDALAPVAREPRGNGARLLLLGDDVLGRVPEEPAAVLHLGRYPRLEPAPVTVFGHLIVIGAEALPARARAVDFPHPGHERVHLLSPLRLLSSALLLSGHISLLQAAPCSLNHSTTLAGSNRTRYCPTGTVGSPRLRRWSTWVGLHPSRRASSWRSTSGGTSTAAAFRQA